MPIHRIALATATETYDVDLDEPLMLEAFAAGGFDVELLKWDAPHRPVSDYDAVILRSTWNYCDDVDGFRAWVAESATQTRLFNPADIVLPNLHKSYLMRLQADGVPVVPTIMVSRGGVVPDLQKGKWVVKPAVGAGSYKVRVLSDLEASTYAAELAKGEDVLIQPYLKSVEDGGERSLVWIGGEFTHKIVKRLRLEADEEAISAASELTDVERQVGEAALRGLQDRLLYARVDVMFDNTGDTVVSELELTEPSLFFLQNPAALERFVEAVQKSLG